MATTETNARASGRAPDGSRPKERALTELARLRTHARFVLELIVDTAERFAHNDGFRLVAAFSYYATFSIFPLLLLAITIAGYVLGESESARERLLDAIANGGSPVREVVERSIGAMQASRGGRGLSAILGLVTLLFAASGAFVELDASLNKIWCVPPRPSKGIGGTIRAFVHERLSGFAIVAALGLTLLVSLLSSSVLQQLAASVGRAVTIPPALLRTADFLVSLSILAAAITAAFHLIPRTRPPVRGVVGGAVLTTILLVMLKELFASYLGNLASYSAYGVAGGTLALATWIYLSSLVLFVGAQLTRVHAEKLGVAPQGERRPGCEGGAGG